MLGASYVSMAPGLGLNSSPEDEWWSCVCVWVVDEESSILLHLAYCSAVLASLSWYGRGSPMKDLQTHTYTGSLYNTDTCMYVRDTGQTRQHNHIVRIIGSVCLGVHRTLIIQDSAPVMMGGLSADIVTSLMLGSVLWCL